MVLAAEPLNDERGPAFAGASSFPGPFHATPGECSPSSAAAKLSRVSRRIRRDLPIFSDAIRFVLISSNSAAREMAR